MTFPAKDSARPAANMLLAADLPSASDSGAGAALDHAAELLAHARAETPFTIGVFGPAGAGKTQAAARLLSRAQALSTAATNGPFVSRLVIVPISAADVADDPAIAIADAMHVALSAPGAGHAGFASAAARASIDPRAAAREANERLDETRRQLDGAKRALDEMDARRARLSDLLLYESAGSPIDAYTRSNRAAIESRLRLFGFTGDPIASFKDLVRDVSEHSGPVGRLRAFFHALWAFPGQARLIVWAILLFIAAWLLALARETNATWLPWLRGLHEQAAPVADWLRDHLDLFVLARQGALALAGLYLALCAWRAIRFLAPLFRGERLLRADVDARRRDLDGQLAHQTRRVDTLAQEVETHARAAGDAEERAKANGATGHVGGSERLFADATASPESRRARAFLDAVETAMAKAPEATPQRIVVAIDDLDALAPARAVEFVESAHRLAARRGFATVLAVDAAHLAAGWANPSLAAQRLQRLVQIPLSATTAGDEALQDFARGLLTGSASPGAMPAPIDASVSALDAPTTDAEAEVIAALAPLAGSTPRAVKRFVNIYRLARARGGDLPALALMLALDSGGASGELSAMGAAMDMEDPDRELRVLGGEPRLAAALAAVNAARGSPLSIAQAQAAWAMARDYRTPL